MAFQPRLKAGVSHAQIRDQDEFVVLQVLRTNEFGPEYSSIYVSTLNNDGSKRTALQIMLSIARGTLYREAFERALKLESLTPAPLDKFVNVRLWGVVQALSQLHAQGRLRLTDSAQKLLKEREEALSRAIR